MEASRLQFACANPEKSDKAREIINNIISEEENKIYDDIIYLNVKNYGYSRHYSEKLYKWFVFATNNYPDAMLIGKIDDDVYLCVHNLFETGARLVFLLSSKKH